MFLDQFPPQTNSWKIRTLQPPEIEADINSTWINDAWTLIENLEQSPAYTGGRTYCQQPDFHRHWFFAVSFVSILLLTPAALRNAASEIYALCANQFRLENICLQLSVHSEHQGSLTFTKTSAFCGRIRCNNHHLGLSQLSPMQSKGIQQPKGQMWMWRLIFAQTHGSKLFYWRVRDFTSLVQKIEDPTNNHWAFRKFTNMTLQRTIISKGNNNDFTYIVLWWLLHVNCRV